MSRKLKPDPITPGMCAGDYLGDNRNRELRHADALPQADARSLPLPLQQGEAVPRLRILLPLSLDCLTMPSSLVGPSSIPQSFSHRTLRTVTPSLRL